MRTFRAAARPATVIHAATLHKPHIATQGCRTAAWFARAPALNR